MVSSYECRWNKLMPYLRFEICSSEVFDIFQVVTVDSDSLLPNGVSDEVHML